MKDTIKQLFRNANVPMDDRHKYLFRQIVDVVEKQRIKDESFENAMRIVLEEGHSVTNDQTRKTLTTMTNDNRVPELFQWVSVSERLPEKEDWYVTRQEWVGDNMLIPYDSCDTRFENGKFDSPNNWQVIEWLEKVSPIPSQEVATSTYSIEDLKNKLSKIAQMSDCGDYARALIRCKQIATEILVTLTPSKEDNGEKLCTEQKGNDVEPIDISAKDFLTNTFNTDFLLPEEFETIVTALELFAQGKVRIALQQ